MNYVLIFAIFAIPNLSKIPRSILSVVIVSITLIAIAPFISSTYSVIVSNGGSYEKTTLYNLSTLPWYAKELTIRDFFNSLDSNGYVLSYAVDSLDYRTKWNVLQMGSILDLAVLKPYVTGNDTESVVKSLKDLNVKYIVVPVEGNSATRFFKLYGHTKILDVLTSSHVTLINKVANIAIYKIT